MDHGKIQDQGTYEELKGNSHLAAILEAYADQKKMTLECVKDENTTEDEKTTDDSTDETEEKKKSSS